MKNDFKQKQGITLIALVITIIVLLILAGVSIATLTGQNGILNRASIAKEETRIAGLEEELKVKFEDNNILLSLGNDEESDELKDVEILGSNEDDEGTFYTVRYKNERFKVYYNRETEIVYDVVYFKLNELNIYTYDELIEFAERVNNGERFEDYIVYLQNDIDLKNEEWIVIGRPSTRDSTEKYFSGIFEGNGHTIDGLSITEDTITSLGLFAGNDGTIQNLNVKESINYLTSWYVDNGGIAGENRGLITNCNVELDATVISDALNYDEVIGGIAGNNYGTISNCKVTGKIETGGKYVGIGGIAATNSEDSKIENCINEATIILNEQGYVTSALEGYAGGIVGENRGRVLKNINKGKIKGYNYLLGGIAGKNINANAIIEECVNMGDFETSFTIDNNRYLRTTFGWNMF